MIVRRRFFIVKDWQILLAAIAGFILYKKKMECEVMRYAVVYLSDIGNTRKIAEEIFIALPEG